MFQAVRNAADLTVMAVPEKYREIGDFHKYYSGAAKAPYLTIFIAGNHEASSHLWELYYGGWVAPNIYYMGAANILRLGPIRVAGISGVWKGYDYQKPHHERLPFNQSDIRSFYHVREFDVRKLLQVRSQVDIGLSHDWPRAIESHGDKRALFNKKSFLKQESDDGTLGNIAATYVLDRLRPPYWFSAHMHVKFSALRKYSDEEGRVPKVVEGTEEEGVATAPEVNPDEIDLDMDDEDETPAKAAEEPANGPPATEPVQEETNEVPEDLRAQLPAAFSRPQPKPKGTPGQPIPDTITNKEVRFLALDKCLPGRHFLQLCDITPHDPEAMEKHQPSADGPRFRLQYDPEWLAINRVFHPLLQVGEGANTSPDLGEDHYLPLILEERKWVEANIVAQGKLDVPENFEHTAPPHVEGAPETTTEQPEEYTNPQTKDYCQLLEISNIWDASAEERAERRERGPAESSFRGGRGGRRGGGRGGRGRGRRGRGDRNRGRGRH